MIIVIKKIMEKTAWQMPVLKAYGTGHILILIFGFSMCFYLLYRCRKFDDKRTDKMFFIIGIVLMISEVYKEMFLATVWQTGYSWNDFPLQLCSMPMYFGVMYPFLKGKAKQTITTFLATFTLMGGFAAVFDPTCSFYSYITMTVHSIAWHFVLIFMGLHLWTSHKNILNFEYAEILYLLLGALAYFLNYIFMDISKNTMNLFFVGPGPAPIILFDDISAKYGPVAESLLFLYVSSATALYIYLAGKLIFRRATAKECKSTKI
ncbi:MAG: YwaF family protein [Clostridia bacterium]|jgi:hypothetical protein|nr:YwaF family protein [Clostridia bacterium]MCI2015327.1 YwaF family protein [Clostridia bacterium]